MRLFSQEGYLSADFGARELVMIGRERGLPLPGTGGFKREAISWKDHDAMEAEHASFCRRVPGWDAGAGGCGGGSASAGGGDRGDGVDGGLGGAGAGERAGAGLTL